MVHPDHLNPKRIPLHSIKYPASLLASKDLSMLFILILRNQKMQLLILQNLNHNKDHFPIPSLLALILLVSQIFFKTISLQTLSRIYSLINCLAIYEISFNPFSFLFLLLLQPDLFQQSWNFFGSIILLVRIVLSIIGL